METNSMVSLKVDESMVSRILEKQIQAAIVAQLGTQEELIAKAVQVALSDKVAIDGSKSKYSSDNTHDFLEVLTSQSIRTAAKAAINEWLQENSNKIKAAVFAELKKPNRQRSIAVAYADAIERSLTCNYAMTCDIKFNEKRE